MLKYKGYTGIVEYDQESEILFGRVVDLNAVITFVGKTTQEAQKSFQDSVDAYLTTCKEKGIASQKALSKNLRVRFEPDFHKQSPNLAVSMA